MKRIELTNEEIQVLAGLMDAGVKSLGLNCVKNAAYLLSKLEQAQDVEPKEKEVVGLHEVPAASAD